jgi:serine/threonine protein kinase
MRTTIDSPPHGSGAAARAAERWARVKELFLAALDRPADERRDFLAAECGGDDDVRREVEGFLGAHEGAGSFLIDAVFGNRSTIGSGDAGVEVGPSLSAGMCLGPYEIIEAIGRGAMGEVYRARDQRLGREVAVKVLPRAMATDALRVARFEQEARAAAAVRHRNIVAVHDAGRHDGLPFLVTELLHGESLEARLARGPIPLAEALAWAVQIAGGLVAAHERGIVHRDLKPANLFLTTGGQIKILDFGVAKVIHTGETARGFATMPGMVLGTAGYMSPEQVRADPVDARSDQFSLGCVLYELLTGQAPFRRPTAIQTMAAVLDDEPRPLAEVDARVPRVVASIVERCLAKDPAHRYASTRDLARDLDLAASHASETQRAGRVLMTGAALLAAGAVAECCALREAAARALDRLAVRSRRG